MQRMALERALTIRGRGRSASSYQEALLLWGRFLITEHISRQKTLGWVESLEGTGSEWAAGAHVHQEDACGAAPVRRAEMEVARGRRGDREAVLTA